MRSFYGYGTSMCQMTVSIHDTRPLDTMIQVLPFRSFYKAILAKAIPRFQFKLPRLVVIESRHLSYPSFTADYPTAYHAPRPLAP